MAVIERWRDNGGDDRVGKRGSKTDRYIERSITYIIYRESIINFIYKDKYSASCTLTLLTWLSLWRL